MSISPSFIEGLSLTGIFGFFIVGFILIAKQNGVKCSCTIPCFTCCRDDCEFKLDTNAGRESESDVELESGESVPRSPIATYNFTTSESGNYVGQQRLKTARTPSPCRRAPPSSVPLPKEARRGRSLTRGISRTPEQRHRTCQPLIPHHTNEFTLSSDSEYS